MLRCWESWAITDKALIYAWQCSGRLTSDAWPGTGCRAPWRRIAGGFSDVSRFQERPLNFIKHPRSDLCYIFCLTKLFLNFWRNILFSVTLTSLLCLSCGACSDIIVCSSTNSVDVSWFLLSALLSSLISSDFMTAINSFLTECCFPSKINKLNDWL